MHRVDIKELLDAGVHFGHRTQRWNPKMKPFIFEARNGIYVINLEKTVTQLEKAQDFLRDIAASLDITERSAFGILTDLVEAGYLVKEKNGRRNRYHIQAHRPLPEPDGRERTVGEILALLTGADAPAT